MIEDARRCLKCGEMMHGCVIVWRSVPTTDPEPSRRDTDPRAKLTAERKRTANRNQRQQSLELSWPFGENPNLPRAKELEQFVTRHAPLPKYS